MRIGELKNGDFVICGTYGRISLDTNGKLIFQVIGSSGEFEPIPQETIEKLKEDHEWLKDM